MTVLALCALLALSCNQGGITRQEQEALDFLYEYMPMADAADYPEEYYLENVRAAIAVRKLWKVPEREWRHFVLPVRVNNESLDGHRVVFQEELLPRIQGLSMKEAILEVNHWCHEKVTYQPSDARTSSPLNTVKNALGRCGEESTFCVAALRSVGIPARQVYTPRWAHTDDNHAWVEAWADGKWWFIGACEPEPVLNLGWFNSAASRAMLMHTRVFGKYDGPEEVVLQGPNYTEINLIDNYAKTARIDIKVLKEDGSPADGARVDFCIYNYAEFYKAVTKYTSASGETFIKAGLGDMIIWASQDGLFSYRKVSFGKDKEVTLTLKSFACAQDDMDIVPPPESPNIPDVTAEQRALNDERFAQEDSIRHAYEDTFLTFDQALVFAQELGYGHHMAHPLFKSRGNWQTIENFLARAEDHERAEAILSSLSTKDLHDITPEILEDYYSARVFKGARIENEFLSPWYGYFQCDAPEATPDSITVVDDPLAWKIPMSPESVWRTRKADPRSLDIFRVAVLRARGEDAAIDPVTGKIGPAGPTGTLKLNYNRSGVLENPKYYSHFTVSRIVDGRPKLLTFDEGELDMGGGTDWRGSFRDGVELEAGQYLLVSGNRLSDGSVPAHVVLFEIEAGAVTEIPLIIKEPADGAVPVSGSFDAETRIMVNGQSVSILSQTGRGFYVVAMLDPGKEPTNHVLRDLASAREALQSWGRPIVLLCQTDSALQRLMQEAAEGRYGQLPATVIYGIIRDARSEPGMTGNVIHGLTGNLPIVLVADTFNRTFFRSEGYTIGIGEQLSGILARL